MKRINIDTQSSESGRNFWDPWGAWGVIWRYLLFLLLLLGFLLLLKWLLSISHNGYDSAEYIEDVHYFDNLDEDIINREEIGLPDFYKKDDTDRYGGYDPRFFDEHPELRGIIEDGDPWRDGGNFRNPIPELPAPDDNFIRPINPDDIITPDDDPYKQIDGSRIDVILDNNDESTFNRFAQGVKQLYPGDDVKIGYYNPEAGLIQLIVDPAQRDNVKDRIRSNITDIDYKLFDDSLFGNSAASSASYNDPAFKSQRKSWHFAPIQAYDAWEVTKGSPDIVVAIIDSYIDISHPELKDRIVKPYSVERKSRNVLPPSRPYSFYNDNDAPIFHGTHVAALAVGALNNSTGAAGLAPECKLMPISLGNDMSSMAILEGILYAINQGADVINLSIGTLFPKGTDQTPLNDQMEYIKQTGTYDEDVWQYVFDLADKRNCTIVWAAGNCNVLSGMDETKRGNNTIRVSAVGPDLKKADFSNFGNFQSQGVNFSDVSAPGVDIYSAGPGNAYGFCPGTSMAAPIVSGAVALMKSVNPELSNSQIIEILDRTGKPVDNGAHIGKLIQVRKALDAVSSLTANFDKIKNDPNAIKGLWKTTQVRAVTDSQTGEPTGENAHIYLKFNSINGGTIYYKKTSGHLHSAPFTSSLNNDKLVIAQTGDTRSNTDPVPFAPVKITCTRGQNGTLSCVSQYAGNTPSEPYHLVRSNENL